MLRQSLNRLLMALGMIAAATAAPAAEPIRVVATVPELGNIAQQIGGDRVRVKVLATILVGLLTSTTSVRGDDWPQWRGPKRDGVS